MIQRYAFACLGALMLSLPAQGQWSNMQPLGGSVNGPVRDFEVFQGTPYAAGSFTLIDGISANYVARWDGTAWSAVGSAAGGAGANAAVVKLHAHDDGQGSRLFATGLFSSVDGSTPASGIAAWNGSAWSALGTGQTGVQDMVSWGNLLVTSSSTAGVMFWDGTAWSAPPSGAPTTTNAIAVFNNQLFVGSALGSVYRLTAPNGTWSAIASPLSAPPLCMAVFQDELYVGSSSTYSGLAKMDASLSWSIPGGVLRRTVACMASVDSCVLFVGGFLQQANGVPVFNVARWDGATWSSLAGGVTDPNGAWAYGMAAAARPTGINLFVGGDFLKANGSPAQHVAKWTESGGADVIETIVVRTGQVGGVPGTPCSADDSFTRLVGNVWAAAPLSLAPFTATDFTAASNGLPAHVADMPYWQPNSLTCDTDARWISSDCYPANYGSLANTGQHGSALYAATFNVTSPSVLSARVSICWRVVNLLGDNFLTPNVNPSGVFLNPFDLSVNPTGEPLSPLFVNTQGTVTVDDAPVRPGLNTLYVYQRYFG